MPFSKKIKSTFCIPIPTVCIGIILFLVTRGTSAQEVSPTKGTWGIRVAGAYGFLIAHRPVLVPLQEAHISGAELSLQFPQRGIHAWEEDFRYPDKGFSLAYFNLGSNDKLGFGLALYPYINFPLGKKNDWNLFFRFGSGLGYVEKVFDAKENIKNAAISSHLNGIIHLGLHITKQTGPSSECESGISLTHFSNGSTLTPNLGINVFCANIAWIRYFGTKSTRLTGIPRKPALRSSQTVSVGAAVKKILPPSGKTFYAGTLSWQRLQAISAKSSWCIGADLFYDNSLQERISRETEGTGRRRDNFRPGIFGGWQLNTGPLGLQFNVGFYPYTRFKGDGFIYQRICLKYYLDKVVINLNLKSHFARADFVEAGVGIRLFKRTRE